MRSQNGLKSLIWPFVEALSAVLTGAVAVLVIARLIGAEAFGLGSIGLGVILMAQVGVNSLVHDALVRSEQNSSEDIDVAFTASVCGSLLVGLIAIIAAPAISHLLNQKALTHVIWALVPMLVLSATSVTMVAERRKALDFSTVATHQIIGRVLGTISGITAAAYGAGVWSLVVQYTCISAYTSGAMYVLASRWPRIRFSRQRLAPMLSFCSPIIGSQLILYAVNWIFLFTMGRLYGMETAGHWGVATRMADSLFGSVIQAAYHVSLARLAVHQAAFERLRGSIIKGEAVMMLAAFPLLVALAVTAEPLVELLLGPSWVPAGQLVLGPLVGSFLLIRQLLPSTGLRVIGISSVSFAATLTNAIAAGFGLLLFSRYSPLAVSAIYALSMVPGYLLIYFTAAKRFHLPFERGILALCRDIALATAAFALGQSISAHLPNPSLPARVAVAGCAAFLIAGCLMTIARRKEVMSIVKLAVSQSPLRKEVKRV